MVKLNVNWLSYLDPHVYGGGGERVSRELLAEGARRGHDVRISSARWGKASRLLGARTRKHRNPHVWLLSDVWNCPTETRRVPAALLREALRSGRYATLDSAWTTVCHRPLFACHGDPSLCPDDCRKTPAREVYVGARRSFFLSPLHSALVQSAIETELRTAIAIPPSVNRAFFVNTNQKRDIPYLFVGTIADYKGAAEVESRFGEAGLHWAGKNVTGRQLKGVHLGFLNDAQLRDVYNRTRCLVHLPQWSEPMGRNVIEALLCGCDVLLNDRVGAAGWGTTEKEIRALPDGAELFWDELERGFAT